MNKYLFMLGDLPPAPSANGVCTEKIIKKLYNKEEDNIHCIIWSDKEIANLYPYKLHFISGRAKKDNNQSKIVKFFARIKYVLSKLVLLRCFPASSLKIASAYYKEAINVIDNNDITHVIAVSFPGETLIALKKLKRKYKDKIITIVYPLDVSLEGDRTRFKLWNVLTEAAGKSVLNKTIKVCDHMLSLENAKEMFINDINKKYHHKLTFVGIPLIENINDIANNKKSDEVVLLYAGYLMHDMYNPLPVLDLIEKGLSSTNKKIIFDFYGVCDDYLRKEIYTKYKHIVFKDNGWISDVQLNEAMAKADIFLNISKAKTNTIPSKVFKYMCFKKTIIHYYFVDDDSCLPYLEKYKNAFLINHNNINEIESIDLDNIGFASDEIDVEEIFPTCTASYTANVIKNYK